MHVKYLCRNLNTLKVFNLPQVCCFQKFTISSWKLYLEGSFIRYFCICTIFEDADCCTHILYTQWHDVQCWYFLGKICQLILWSSRVLVFQTSGLPDFWSSRLLVFGLLDIWTSYHLEFWTSVLPDFWSSGCLAFRTSRLLALLTSSLLSWCPKNVLIETF